MLIDRVIVGSMHTNAYIIATGKKECILIDPGASRQMIIKRLEAMNLIPQAIVFTHGHLDHTSAAGGIIDHYAKRKHHVPCGIHQADLPYLGEHAADTNQALFERFGQAGLDALDSFALDVPSAEFLLEDGKPVLDSDLLVMHTPGHSDGSVCIYAENRGAVFSGDTLFFNTIGRADVPNGDPEVIRMQVAEKLFELPADTRVFPGHGPTTVIEREIQHNPLSSTGATI